jgi:hypothetical protein
MVARDDGTEPTVLGHGQRPVVSPDGRKVVFLAKARATQGDLRLRRIGSSRSVQIARGISSLSPAVWSPNSRYLIARSDRSDGGILIDTKLRKRHPLVGTTLFAGASFAPDSSRVAFATLQSSGGTLWAADVQLRRVQGVADGFSPAWGEAGIAFADDIGHVYLKRSLHSHQRLLLHEPGRDPQPVAWATRAHRLLLAERLEAGGFMALVIDSDTGAVAKNPYTFTRIDGIARHGHTLLGERGGDVVAAHEGGTLETLAHDARAASWTK